MLSVQQQAHGVLVRGVAADNAVASEDPEVALLSDHSVAFWSFRDLVRFCEVIVQGFGQSGDEAFHFLVGVAGQLYWNLACVNVGENVSQQLVVDLCQLCDPVVSHQIGVFLGLVRVVLVVHRHFGESFELGSSEAAVALYYEAGALRHCDRCPPPGLADNAAECLDLCVRVCVRVLRVGDQLLNGHDRVMGAEYRYPSSGCLWLCFCFVVHLFVLPYILPGVCWNESALEGAADLQL